MLQWLLELLLGVALYAVLAYYLFLYNSTDDDDENEDEDNSSSRKAVGGGGEDGDVDADARMTHCRTCMHMRSCSCNNMTQRTLYMSSSSTLQRSRCRWLLYILTTYLYGRPCSGWTPRRRRACCGRHDRARRQRHAATATARVTQEEQQQRHYYNHANMGSNGSSWPCHHADDRDDSTASAHRRCVYCSRCTTHALRTDTVQWLNVLVRYAALLALGGGSVQPLVWQQRCHRHVERALLALNAASEAARQRRLHRSSNNNNNSNNNDSYADAAVDTIGSSSNSTRLHDGDSDAARPLALLRALTLGAGCYNSSSVVVGGGSSVSGSATRNTAMSATATAMTALQDEMSRLASPVVGPMATSSSSSNSNSSSSSVYAVGVVLPRIAGDVTSTETTATVAKSTKSNSNNKDEHDAIAMSCAQTLRCFACRLVYEDTHFALHLSCAVPLLWFLPPQLRISVDALSLDCDVAVQRVAFDGVVHVACCGARVEVCFATTPRLDATVDITPPFTATTTNSSSNSNNSHRSAAAAAVASRAAMQPVTAVPSSSVHTLYNSGGGSSECVVKTRELALRALQRVALSLTYPNVLQCTAVARRGGDDREGDGAGNDSDNDSSDGDSGGGWRLQWRKATASLPRDAFVATSSSSL